MFNQAITYLCIHNKKERLCHVLYVLQIALQLQERFGWDREVIWVAAILHDVGRGRELEWEYHEVAGERVAREFLKWVDWLSDEQKELIVRCVRNHGAEFTQTTIEEKIITSADSASKLLYHDMFMLMCKKQSYIEKAQWGLKYIEKGYWRIQIPEYKQELHETYMHLKHRYESISIGDA